MGTPLAQAFSTDAFPGACLLDAGGQELLMLPERAVFHPASRSLLLADVHLGKAATFRMLGVTVPSGTTERTLARLDVLLRGSGARALYLLGDLLHGPHGRQAEMFDALSQWRARHPSVEVVLVRGNHDSHAGDPPARCGIDVVDPGHGVAGLRLLHEPEPDYEPASAQGPASPLGLAREPEFSLAGHLHPVWRLGARADRLRLPCFWVRRRGMVLPAFGEFTGGWPARAGAEDRIYVTDGEAVRAVPAGASRRARA
jgi:DNA ligase-associated metallophosphoesterase